MRVCSCSLGSKLWTGSFGHPHSLSSTREVRPPSPSQYCRSLQLKCSFLSEGRCRGSKGMHVVWYLMILKHSSDGRGFSSRSSEEWPPQMCSIRSLGNAWMVIQEQSWSSKVFKYIKGGRDLRRLALHIFRVCKRGKSPSPTPDHSDHLGISVNVNCVNEGNPLTSGSWLQNSLPVRSKRHMP